MFELDATITHEQNDNDKWRRSPEYKDWRASVVAAYRAADMNQLADEFEACAEAPKMLIGLDTSELPEHSSTVWACGDNMTHPHVLMPDTCDCRTCPDCARRQTARLAETYVPRALELQNQNKPGFNLRHIILTTPYDLAAPDARERLDETFDAVMNIWDELLPPRWIDEQGILVSAEYGSQGKKLHFHVTHYGQYISQAELSAKWREATNSEAEITYVKSMVGMTAEETANKIIETVKYSVKFWKRDKNGSVHYIEPELMPVLSTVLHKQRRIRSRGVFFNFDKPAKQPFCCSTCGAGMERIGKDHWQTYRKTGFTLKEWKALQSSSLNSKLANKSFSKSGEADNRLLPTQKMLPDMPAFEPKGRK